MSNDAIKNYTQITILLYPLKCKLLFIVRTDHAVFTRIIFRILKVDSGKRYYIYVGHGGVVKINFFLVMVILFSIMV